MRIACMRSCCMQSLVCCMKSEIRNGGKRDYLCLCCESLYFVSSVQGRTKTIFKIYKTFMVFHFPSSLTIHKTSTLFHIRWPDEISIGMQAFPHLNT